MDGGSIDASIDESIDVIINKNLKGQECAREPPANIAGSASTGYLRSQRSNGVYVYALCKWKFIENSGPRVPTNPNSRRRIEISTQLENAISSFFETATLATLRHTVVQADEVTRCESWRCSPECVYLIAGYRRAESVEVDELNFWKHANFIKDGAGYVWQRILPFITALKSTGIQSNQSSQSGQFDCQSSVDIGIPLPLLISLGEDGESYVVISGHFTGSEEAVTDYQRRAVRNDISPYVSLRDLLHYIDDTGPLLCPLGSKTQFHLALPRTETGPIMPIMSLKGAGIEPGSSPARVQQQQDFQFGELRIDKVQLMAIMQTQKVTSQVITYLGGQFWRNFRPEERRYFDRCESVRNYIVRQLQSELNWEKSVPLIVHRIDFSGYLMSPTDYQKRSIQLLKNSSDDKEDTPLFFMDFPLRMLRKAIPENMSRNVAQNNKIQVVFLYGAESLCKEEYALIDAALMEHIAPMAERFPAPVFLLGLWDLTRNSTVKKEWSHIFSRWAHKALTFSPVSLDVLREYASDRSSEWSNCSNDKQFKNLSQAVFSTATDANSFQRVALTLHLSRAAGISFFPEVLTAAEHIYDPSETNLPAKTNLPAEITLSSTQLRAFAELEDAIFDRAKLRKYKLVDIPPARILFYGAGGSGKSTLINKLRRKHPEVPFRIVQLPELFSQYLGETEGNIRGLFEESSLLLGHFLLQCRKTEQELTVLVLKGIDEFLRKSGSATDEFHIRVRTTLLLCLDSVDRQSQDNSLCIIGVSRRTPEDLDNALTRPGRLETWIELQGREGDSVNNAF